MLETGHGAGPVGQAARIVVRHHASVARARIARAWEQIRPGSEARRGAVWGCLGAAAVAVGVDALYINLGWGLWLDLVVCSVASALIMGAAWLSVRLILFVARKLPASAAALMVGSCLVIAFVVPSEVGPPVAISVGLLEGFFGAAVATFVLGAFRRAALPKKVIAAALLLLTASANVVLILWLRSDGTLADVSAYQPRPLPVAPVGAPDPGLPGPFRVKTLTYGSGTDRTRAEYGAAVALRTRTVDASKFLRGVKPWQRAARRAYWGFDTDSLPLNATVWYPDGPGPFPLVLVVHGNHAMVEPSEHGYAYLGELLASRGFILASVDENFLNSGLFHRMPGDQPVRAWLLLEHLRLWREWKDQPGHPFYRRVDFDRIAVMGHSRGGEAAATAALFNRLSCYPEDASIRFDYAFPIRSVVAIAPDDGHYRPAGEHRTISDVSYLVLQGGWDADVSSFRGSRQFDYVKYTQPGPSFKSELWIYRANHGQFNTVWGRVDAWGPLRWLLNLEPVMDGDAQRRVAKVYITAFLEATLRDRREYVSLFRNWQAGRDWLPRQVYLNRFEDASSRVLAAFNEDPDLTTTTWPGGRAWAEGFALWREGRIPLRRGQRDYNGVFLGWNRRDGRAAPSYEIALPAAGVLSADSVLTVSAAALDEVRPGAGARSRSRESLDFTIELETAGGIVARQPVSRFAEIAPPLHERFTKVALLEEMTQGKSTEPVLQGIEAPVGAFAGVDPGEVRKVRFRFDRTASGVILITRVSVSRTTDDLSRLRGPSSRF